MKEGGAMTSAQIADKMKLNERFVREWLYQQVGPVLGTLRHWLVIMRLVATQDLRSG